METKRSSKRKAKRVRINVTLCRYEVVRRVARARGWKLVTDEKPEGKPSVCNLHWIDVPDILPTFKALLPYQKVNHGQPGVQVQVGTQSRAHEEAVS